jgi:hypothetical protein
MKRLLSVFGTIGAVLLLAVPASYTEDNGHEYVGTKNCRKCHIKEHKSWAATKMAKAFDSLKPGVAAEKKTAAGLDPDKDYTKEAECLGCHTTGYGKAGGFVDIETTPDLAGVGCESCHGAGGNYVQDQYMSLKNKNYKREDIVAAGMVGEITAARCTTQCHNEKSPFAGADYQFDFESMRQKGGHENFPLKYQH